MKFFRPLTLAVAIVAAVMLGAIATAPSTVAAQAAAQRQNQTANVGQLVSGLINVNVGAVQLAVETGDITLVNVEDVLNNSQIDILNNVLNNNTILSNNSNFLNNLLQNANILTENQIVVGVLSGGQIVFQNV